ncbi:SDR family NAD(P)-dependent oxidoreductase [Sphingomonas sp. LM7]|uniref:SDR family NAD(P)-dependent oxidoreductase n=1 Tax=Sphingomonas sp. LM7 TaxID=1938607 RepID=UPI000983DB67|nr:SDR family oxidoreductase [Sphingomonas sp. LM7]AQR72449.1 hypothetical protein BXU08_01110 [Sphingomonas sp. LM7]
MSGRYAGEIALVTGAAGGIGGAIARRFASEGARVIAVDRTKAVIGDSVLADLADPAAVPALAVALEAQGIYPSVVVHAAANGESRATMATDAAFLRDMFAVNVGAVFALAQAFAPAMQARRAGAFLFISSINSTFATPGLAAYAASKAALDSVTRTLALELAPDGVRVNAIRPASIDTPLLRRGFDSQPDPEAARMRNVTRHPLGRLGTAEDVAALAAFLCSAEAGWITGGDYLVDGGAAVTRR